MLVATVVQILYLFKRYRVILANVEISEALGPGGSEHDQAADLQWRLGIATVDPRVYDARMPQSILCHMLCGTKCICTYVFFSNCVGASYSCRIPERSPPMAQNALAS